MTLKSLTARIEQLQAARAEIDAVDPALPAPIPQATDWEARLSAACCRDYAQHYAQHYAVRSAKY